MPLEEVDSSAKAVPSGDHATSPYRVFDWIAERRYAWPLRSEAQITVVSALPSRLIHQVTGKAISPCGSAARSDGCASASAAANARTSAARATPAATRPL